MSEKLFKIEAVSGNGEPPMDRLYCGDQLVATSFYEELSDILTALNTAADAWKARETVSVDKVREVLLKYNTFSTRLIAAELGIELEKK